jgi:uncharacterized OB-fold protein
MTGPNLLKLDLYAESEGRVTLKGGRCSACGHVFFPMQTRGCEKCGAHGNQLIGADLGGSGVLAAAAVVHVHAGKSRTAPFVMGTIDLDSGPRIRTLLADAPDAESRVGSIVTAVLVDTAGPDGAAVRDLRFRLA